MRWPLHHTCHNLNLPKFTPKLIEFGPLTKRGEWQTDAQGIRFCPVCDSIHPEDLHSALVDKRVTIHLAEHDGWPSRLMLKGFGGVRHFSTLHLGDYGYGSDSIKALCTEISKAQSKYIWEPDVDGIYWRPKEEAQGVANNVRKLSKLLKPVSSDIKLPKAKTEEEIAADLNDWKKRMEADVNAFRKDRRGW